MNVQEIINKLPEGLQITMATDQNSGIEYINDAYRKGTPFISNPEYDFLLSHYGISTGVFMDEIVAKVHPKSTLDYPMGSMEKVKDLQEIRDWEKSKKIPQETTYVITPKYDGMSIQTNESAGELLSAKTRGDGLIGRLVTKVLKKVYYQNVHTIGEKSTNGFYYGEVIMPKAKFEVEFSKTVDPINGYENPRNLIPGLFADENVSDYILNKVHYVRYGKIGFQYSTKEELLKSIARESGTIVPFWVIKSKDLTEEFLLETFKNFSDEYEIDGLVIEINDEAEKLKLGLETNSLNPKWARAYKPDVVGDKSLTKIVDITYNVSKDGKMKPVLQIEPVKLNGATITNVFADNVRFLYDYGLGIGSNIEVKRSGGIIPRVSKVEGIDVIPAKEMKKIKDKVANSFIMVKDVAELNGLPNNFKIPNYKDEQCFWDSSKIELIIPNADNDDEVKLQRIIFFFETIGVENVSDKTFRYLYSQGYDTIKKVLEMNAAELTNFEGFGESKSEIVVKSIQRAWSKVKFIKLLYATNYFSGMGEDKINLIINHFKNKTIYELSKFEVVDFQVVTGIAEITAKIFKDNIIKASDFILELGWTAEKEIEEKPKEIAKSGICLGWTCCFTKFRDKVLEKAIVENGGTVIDKFNNSITHVFIENNSISSVKVDKAREKGCVIMTKEELYNFLGIKDENQKEQGLF